ncbi:MAG: tetratricopeptide repeat protein [candidate division WOR-3 bacterium]|nr:tetratricopeptide repeat protein [candidate division WOR-3 bacterium]
MSIKGSLHDFSIVDILQMLSFSNKTGELAVTEKEAMVYIYLNSGMLIHVDWVNRKDKLGSILVENGIINEETLKEVLELQEEQPNAPLGEMLCKLDLIDTEILKKYIKKQMIDAIIELAGWDNGYFVFESKEPFEYIGIPVSIKIDDVLIESATLQDELKASSLPDKDSILVRSSEWESKTQFSDEEEKVLEKVDGKKSLSYLINSLPMEEIRIVKILSHFLKEGIIKEVKSDGITLERAEAKTDEYRNLGVAFIRIGMYKESLREFDRILELKPGDPEALFYKGIIKFELGEIEDAENVFNMSQDKIEKTETLNNLSIIKDLQGDLESGLRYISWALGKEKNNPKIILNKAIILLKLGKIEEGFEVLSKLQEKTVYTEFYHAYILAKQRKPEEALTCLQNGLSMNPKFGEYFYNLGKLYEAFMEEKEAAEIYKRGLKTDPDSTILIKALIDYYYRNNIFDQCEKKIDAAISSGVVDWELDFKRGNILYKKGHSKEAIEAWEKALKLNPDNQTIKRSIELAEKNGNN